MHSTPLFLFQSFMVVVISNQEVVGEFHLCLKSQGKIREFMKKGILQIAIFKLPFLTGKLGSFFGVSNDGG